MPKISTFMYCEGSQNEVQPNGQQRLHIIGPLQIFTPVFTPGTMSFSVVLGILDINLDKNHSIQYVFKASGEEDSIIDTGKIPLPIITDPSTFDLPNEMRGVMLNLGFQNVVFRNDGTYLSEIYYDDEKIGEFPISVKGKERLV